MRRRPMPNALDIDLRGGLTDKVTPHAGSALLIDAIRRSGVPAAAERHLPAKRSPPGSRPGRDDRDVRAPLGPRRRLPRRPRPPAPRPRASRPSSATTCLRRPPPASGSIASTSRSCWRVVPAQGSFIQMESAGLAGLRAVLVTAIRSFVADMPVSDAVTLDVDAHLVESSKTTAPPTYEGFRGFQPALVSWAETGLVLADQSRDGNGPASVGLDDLVDEACAALPAGEPGRSACAPTRLPTTAASSTTGRSGAGTSRSAPT